MIEEDQKKRHKKLARVIAAVLLVVVIVAGIVIALHIHNHHEKAKATFTSKLTLLTGSQPITTNIISITSSGFGTEQLTVKKGAIVSWFNVGKTKETVTEDDGRPGPNSGIIPSNKIYQYQYNNIGSFKYHSALGGSNFTGTVVVVNQLPISGQVPSTSYTTTGDYKGWKSYSLKYEKLSFFYPSTFQLTDTSSNGHDQVTLKGTNGFKASLQTGNSAPLTLPANSTIVHSIPVQFVGQKDYLDYLASAVNPNLITQVNVSTNATDATAAPTALNTSGFIEMNAGYSSNNPGEALTSIAKDSNYLDAQLIIQSMHY
jgi:plastocyanin